MAQSQEEMRPEAEHVPSPPDREGPPQPAVQTEAPPSQQVVYVQPVQAPSNGMATAGGVLGIIGLVLGLIPFVGVLSLLLGPLAVILGGVGLRRANAGAAGKGMAITGLVCGILAIAFVIVGIAALGSTFGNNS